MTVELVAPGERRMDTWCSDDGGRDAVDKSDGVGGEGIDGLGYGVDAVHSEVRHGVDGVGDDVDSLHGRVGDSVDSLRDIVDQLLASVEGSVTS